MITTTPRQNRQAFTMVEVAICIAIVGFAMVAIMGVLPKGLQVQKDNREDTFINQDAQVIIEAIRTGTNSFMPYNLASLSNNLIWLTISNSLGVVNGYTNLTPAQVVGLLSTPRFQNSNEVNYVRARMIAFSGSLSEDTGVNPDLAFTYLLTSEIVPYAYQVVLTNGTPGDQMHQLSTNLYEVRLVFRWPVLPGPANSVGNGRRVFRTMIPGQLVRSNGTNGAPDPTNGVYHYFHSTVYANSAP